MRIKIELEPSASDQERGRIVDIKDSFGRVHTFHVDPNSAPQSVCIDVPFCPGPDWRPRTMTVIIA